MALLWAYLRTLSPAFPPNDSPETIAAAFGLGIQHPPGYPLAALLGRLGIVSLPLGSAAWRMNLLSALLALATLGLLGTLAWRLSEGATAAWRAAVALMAAAFGGLWAPFWEQATEAKGGIYLLNLGLGLGLWHAALSAVRGSQRGVKSAWLLAGLLLANHYMSAAPWLLAVGLWAVWAWKRGSLPRPLHSAWLLLPGLALYLYLPVRAGHFPVLDLGHPRDWAQFKWMLTRSGYGEGPPLSMALVLDQLRTLGRALGSQAAYAALPVLAAWALWAQRSRPDRAVLAMGSAAALSGLAGAVLNSTPADNRWLVLIFTLPAMALLAVLGAVALGALLRRRSRWAGAWLAAVLLLLLGGAWRQWPSQDRRHSFTAWDYARDLALGLPRGALYIADGDYHVLPLLHLQGVEGKRRDVTLVLAPLAARPWYQGLFLRRDDGLLLAPAATDAEAARALARAEAPRRSVVLGPHPGALDAASLQPLQLRQRGLARELAPAFEAAAPALHLAWSSRPPERPPQRWEPAEAGLLPWYTVGLVQAGNESLATGRLAEALQQYRQALQRPGAKPAAAIHVNLARTWEAAGSDKAARRAYEQALQADPGFSAAQEGLDALQARAKQGVAALLARADRLAAQGGHDAEALKLYDRALQSGFQTAGLWRNIGVIFLRNGDRAQAARAFEQGLRLKPGDPTLTQYLGAAAP